MEQQLVNQRKISDDEILDVMLEAKCDKHKAMTLILIRETEKLPNDRSYCSFDKTDKCIYVNTYKDEETYDAIFRPEAILDNLTDTQIVTMVNFIFTYENHFIHEQFRIDKYEELYKTTILEYLADYTRDHFQNCDDMEDAFLVEYNPNNLVCYIDSIIKMKDNE